MITTGTIEISALLLAAILAAYALVGCVVGLIIALAVKKEQDDKEPVSYKKYRYITECEETGINIDYCAYTYLKLKDLYKTVDDFATAQWNDYENTTSKKCKNKEELTKELAKDIKEYINRRK